MKVTTILPVRESKALTRALYSRKPEICTLLAILGVGLSTASAIKATNKVRDIIDENPNITKPEILKESIKAYSKTLIFATGTMICISMAHSASQARTNAYKGLLAAAATGGATYAQTVKEKYGEEAHKAILREVVKGDENSFLFYDKATGKYFESSLSASIIDDDIDCYIIDSRE